MLDRPKVKDTVQVCMMNGLPLGQPWYSAVVRDAVKQELYNRSRQGVDVKGRHGGRLAAHDANLPDAAEREAHLAQCSERGSALHCQLAERQHSALRFEPHMCSCHCAMTLGKCVVTMRLR